MSRLTCKLGRLTLSSPVLGASGCFGHGYEMARFMDPGRIGGFTLKTVTPTPRKGNKPPRIWEIGGSMMSSIGLQNAGIEAFMAGVMPRVLELGLPGKVIVSIGGDTVEEYAELAARFTERYEGQIAAIEVNASCPNSKSGAGMFCREPARLEALVAAVVRATHLPVIGKMNTNFENYCDAARAIEQAGADAVYTSNTPIGMAIDIEARRPALGNVKGPLQGPAVRPIGVGKTWDIYQCVGIPIVPSGGIFTASDALEYIMAGATAVGVGCAHFIQPDASVRIQEDLDRWLAENDVGNYAELIGAAHNRQPA